MSSSFAIRTEAVGRVYRVRGGKRDEPTSR